MPLYTPREKGEITMQDVQGIKAGYIEDPVEPAEPKKKRTQSPATLAMRAASKALGAQMAAQAAVSKHESALAEAKRELAEANNAVQATKQAYEAIFKKG